MTQTLLPSRAVMGFTALLSLLCVLLQPFQEILLYRRELVLAGEAWRLLSANLVHTNTYHLYLNLAGLWLFTLICGSTANLKILNFSIIFIGLFITSCLLLIHPHIQWYAGLSGVLYGLFIMAAFLLAIAGEIMTCLLLLLLLLLRLALSDLELTALNSEQLIEAPVLIESHIYGALGGLLCGLGLLYSHWRARINST